MRSDMTYRRYDLDWLRLLAIAMIILHAGLSSYPTTAVAMGASYVAANALMVILLGRRKPLPEAAPVVA